MNLPPQITLPPNASEQQPLRIISEQTTLVVAANDPEDEIVSFVWLVPHGVPHEVTEWQNDNGDYISTLSLQRDEVLHGQIITCTVADQAKPRNVIHIEWNVEVL